MAYKNVIEVDESKCIGCGKCVNACHQSVLELVDGKAKVINEPMCDGLGRCIGQCPVDAIHFTKKEVEEPKTQAKRPPAGGCPGMMMKKLDREGKTEAKKDGDVSSQLGNWPVQLKLVNPTAPYFMGADVLLAADCTAFALGAFHGKLLKDKSVMIACPKLDDREGYVEKIRTLLEEARPTSLTIARMEVPCCGGLTAMVADAAQGADFDTELREVTVSVDGEIKDERVLRKAKVTQS